MSTIADELEHDRQRADLSVTELWFRYVGAGGTCSLRQVKGYLSGALEADAENYELLTRTLWGR